MLFESFLSAPFANVQFAALTLLALTIYGGAMYNWGQRQGLARASVVSTESAVKTVNHQLKRHGIILPAEQQHATMMSSRRVAERLAKYIRSRGDTRWLHKDLIEYEYYKPMLVAQRISARSWESVYRELCQNPYSEKTRVCVGSNEEFAHLWDYCEQDRPYLVRIAGTLEVEQNQQNKVSNLLNSSRSSQDRPRSTKKRKKASTPSHAKPKRLKKRQLTWNEQGSGHYKEAA